MCEWRQQHQSGDSSIREETVLIAVSLTLSCTPLLSRCLTLTLSHSLAVSTHTLLSPLSSLLLMTPLSFSCCCLHSNAAISTLILMLLLSPLTRCCLKAHTAVSTPHSHADVSTLHFHADVSTLHSPLSGCCLNSHAAVCTLMLH